MFNRILLLFVVFGMTADLSKAAVGSIWPENAKFATGAGLFSDPVASSIGDLITITVNLQTSATKNQSTDTAKTASVNDVLNAFMYPQGAGDFNWYYKRDLPPTFNWSAAHAFKGGGQIANTETLATTIQAKVVDVLSNNTLQIEAKRHFETSNEKGTLILTGIIRRQDLDSSNTVSSNQVADLQIKQEGVGPLSREQHKGWLTTIYEAISPF
jgi:flagellar L-ring protein precursor FlgH